MDTVWLYSIPNPVIEYHVPLPKIGVIADNPAILISRNQTLPAQSIQNRVHIVDDLDTRIHSAFDQTLSTKTSIRTADQKDHACSFDSDV